jgi:hypothetical protein
MEDAIKFSEVWLPIPLRNDAQDKSVSGCRRSQHAYARIVTSEMSMW